MSVSYLNSVFIYFNLFLSVLNQFPVPLNQLTARVVPHVSLQDHRAASVSSPDVQPSVYPHLVADQILNVCSMF